MIRVTIAVDGDVCEDLVMPAAPAADDLVVVERADRERVYRVLHGRAWFAGDPWLLQLQADRIDVESRGYSWDWVVTFEVCGDDKD